MKKLLSVLAVLTLSVLFVLSAFAAEGKTVYVADGGTGDGTSAESPLGNLDAAFSALDGKGGTVVLVGNVTRGGTTIPEQSGDLTITSINGAKLIVAARTTIEKNTNDNVFYFDMPLEVTATSAQSLEGRFNSVVFTENFSVECSGGTNSSFSYYGGYIFPSTNEAAVTELPYSITVNAGTFRRFEGGSIRSSGSIVGSIAAPLTVTINGGTFGAEGEYDALAPNKIFNGFNFAGMNILADGGTLTINGGTFNVPVYVAGHLGQTGQGGAKNSTLTMSDKKYYAIDGDISVNINGGVFNGGAVAATYVEAGYTFLVRGNYTVNVNGGTFKTGTVFDATQVKAYAGEDKKATITIKDGVENVTAKRFDTVNGTDMTGTFTEPLRVAFIGDSITEGHSSSDRVLNSYSARYLENALAAGEDVIVCNFGISSAGMQPGKNYYTPDMLSTVISLNECDADIFVFALGTNDSDYSGRSTGAALEFYDRYKALIKEHGDRPDTDRVYVTSIMPRDYRNPTTGALVSDSSRQTTLRGITVARQLQKQIAEDLAADEPNKYFFLDFYAMCFDMMTTGTHYKDSVHPNDAGYIVMGEKVYNAIHKNELTNDSFYLTDVYVSDNGTPYGTGTENDPISLLEYAFDRLAPTATVHILDTISFGGHINTPRGMEKLTIVGETEGATFNLTSTGGVSFTIGSNLKLDNFALVSASNDITIMANYNDVEITDTVTTSGTVRFYAGHNVWYERAESDLTEIVHFATAEWVSSDRDVTITLNGGDYTVFLGGNRRTAKNSPYGTYSGNMVINIGEGVTINEPTVSALSGANYLTGTITANINGWGAAPIREYTYEANVATDKFSPSNNNGKITLNVADTVTADRIVMGDFNGDNQLNIQDVLFSLRALLNHTDLDTENHYFQVEKFSILNVVHLLKQTVK